MRISEGLPTPAHRPKGGLPGGLRIRVLVRLYAFELAGRVAAARIDWIEVGLLSVRVAGVSVGIGRGRIVDSVGYLGARLP